MPSLQETLQRLAGRFAARDIMTPRERMTTAGDVDEAARKLDEYPQYDVIPIRQSQHILAFLERGASKQRIIQIQHLISAETAILDLVDSLCDRPFTFVVGRHQVVGLVQLADLNDPIVKLPYFVLLEGLERHVADALRPMVVDENLGQFGLDRSRLTSLMSKKARLQKAGTDRDWVTLLYFRELLEAAVHLGSLRLSPQEIEDLSVVRNRVAHVAAEELIETRADVRRLSKVRTLCAQALFVNEPA